ncbi:hypothetical protein Aperf_G00000074196 [Anoplocephala perfoliata]
MLYEMNHILELIDIDYPSPLNESPAHIVFSRAFLRDCYRGYRPETYSQSSSSPKSNLSQSQRGSPALSSTDSPESQETSSHSFSQVPSTSNVYPCGARSHRHVTEASTEGEELLSIYKEMQDSGCPTSFVSSKQTRSRSRTERPTSSPRSWRHVDRLADLDAMVLRNFAQPSGLYVLARSLPNLHVEVPRDIPNRHLFKEECFYSEAACRYSAVCNILKLSFVSTHSNCHMPTRMHFYLPDSWRQKNIRNLKRTIESTLLGHGLCSPLDHKPEWLSPSHNVNVPPPEKLLETGAGDAMEIEKYWNQRYRLFSRFDEGIQIDREGLFSVTPEVIAIHQARRLHNLMRNEHNPVALDLFTGVGGNCIQLALAGFHVVTVDVSERMQEMARSNAEIYGVIDRIRFVRSDVFDFLRSAERFDAILASPPWGGPDYSTSIFSLAKIKFGDEKDIFDLVEAIAPKIKSGGPVALFLPRNVNTAQLFTLHQRFVAADPLDVVPCLECETGIINNKVKAITLYLHYGERCGEFAAEVNESDETLAEEVADNEDVVEASALDRNTQTCEKLLYVKVTRAWGHHGS